MQETVQETTQETVIEARHLTKRFGSVAAVCNVSFCISTGEIVGLLGPNGAGKTTLIQMMLGLVTPTSGEIFLLGKDIRRDTEAILSQVNFSSTYVSMPTSLTLYENLSIFAGLYGVARPEEEIERVMAWFEIAPLRRTLTKHLSSGQMTRLCLAKALLNRPRVLFLDEPTASLDPDAADKTRARLRSLRDRDQMTIFYTSHNMQEMESISDRILLLQQGEIVAAGTPAEVIQNYGKDNLEDVFLKVARGES